MMRFPLFCFVLSFGSVLFACEAWGVVTDEEIQVEGEYLMLRVKPTGGGPLDVLGWVGAEENFSGADGLLVEGFGVGSYYVGGRRLNETLEVLDSYEDRPVFRYSYDGDGPNIRGLHVSRLMEPLPDEGSIRVTLTVENRGDERQWIAPWVRNDVLPGGGLDVGDRLDVPTLTGIVQPRSDGYLSASRNWIAATDPAKRVTLYGVYHAEDTFAFRSEWEGDSPSRAFQTVFVPRMLAPGASWSTTYRVNVVRGLQHVDFATDELAVQLDYETGQMTLLIASVKRFEEVSLHGRIVAPNGRVWRLPTKNFMLGPGAAARCTYGWVPPADGSYEFIAELRRDEVPVALGKDTGSPHGGIDTQFVVGEARGIQMAAWSDAPYALERGARARPGALAAREPVPVWFASSLEKVFPRDVVKEGGLLDRTVRLSLAGNERESFQVVLRPPPGKNLVNVELEVGELVDARSGARIEKDAIATYVVGFHDIRIPSYFEGPTGPVPDALLPHRTPIVVKGGTTRPLWFTVFARAGLPAGTYRGEITVRADGLAPIALRVEARVYDFSLPKRSALKTDFGFWREAALRGAKAIGGTPTVGRLDAAYRENASAHRVTLRTLSGLPAESADYSASLDAYAERLDALQGSGVTSISVPSTLLDIPEQLRQANAFIKKEGLQNLAFVHLYHEPLSPAWPRLLETMQRWKEIAPDIPIMVTTGGIKPFIPEVLDRWAVHAQVFDTVNNQILLEAIAGGREVWWYINHAPPRPYGNFFIDFAPIEHRVLFWQAWALGIKGMHYWSVNYIEPGCNPWKSALDVTPVNGDGLLVYPGPEGPINSIRWENIRDGIEDYDYLALFSALRKRLETRGGHEVLLEEAARAYDLGEVVPNLVTFSRDVSVLLEKREALGASIEAMTRALVTRGSTRL